MCVYNLHSNVNVPLSKDRKATFIIIILYFIINHGIVNFNSEGILETLYTL